MPGHSNHQNRRSAVWAVVALVLTALYQGLWYVAPDVLTVPLWDGSALTVAFLLGSLSFVVPVVIAWIMVKGDRSEGETFETSHH